MEWKVRHLEMIQAVISRMNANAFLIKGWALTLVVGLLTLLVSTKQQSHALVVLMPVVMFWGSDGFYVRQERLFRRLYDHVRACSPIDVDFSMATELCETTETMWRWAICSASVWPYYSVLTLAVIAVVLFRL